MGVAMAERMPGVFDNQKLVAWYVEQVLTHPEGVVPVHIAARMCSCSREGFVLACKSRKMRLMTFEDRPRVQLVPLLDVFQWQAARAGTRFRVRDWGEYIRNVVRHDCHNLERIGGVVVCTRCGRADAAG